MRFAPAFRMVHKLGLLVIVFLLASASTGAAIYVSNGQIRERTEQADRLFGTEQLYYGLVSLYNDVGTIAYRLLAEGYEKRQTEAYEQKLGEMSRLAGQLRPEFESDAELRSYLNWFEELRSQYGDLYRDSFSGAFLASDLNGPAIRTVLAKQTADVLRIDGELRTIFEARNEANSSALRRTLGDSASTVAWMLASASALSVAAAILFARSVARGSGRVMSRIDEMKEGRAAAPMGRPSRDEFGAIERHLVETGTRLRASLDANEAAGGRLAAVTSEIETRSGENRDAASAVSRLAALGRSELERQFEATAAISSIVQQAAAGAQLAAAAAETIRAQAEETNELATSGSAELGLLMASLRETNERLAELRGRAIEASERTEEAGRFLDGIRGIAKQTNLLSFNASIEAARSKGAASSGFGVIAEEIRRLAGQTDDFSREARALMEGMRSELAGMAEEVIRHADRMRDTLGGAGRASDSLAAIAACHEALARGIGELRREAGEIAEGMDGIVGSVDELLGASGRVNEQMGRMTELAGAQESLSGRLGDAVLELLDTSAALRRV